MTGPVKRRRGLTPEEEALWRRAIRDVAPSRSKRPKPEPLVSAPHTPIGHAPRSITQPAMTPRRISPGGHGAGGGNFSAPPAPPSYAPHPMQAGDPALDRRAGRGRLPIDAVLDLHGHTQTTARGVLHRFIREGYDRGARCLLVITGKGTPGLRDGHDARAGRGVLRGRMRDWLAEEPVRALVSRASPAHQRHGGGGAFYIFLKR